MKMKALLFAFLSLLFAVSARGQWVTETYPLKVGYNAIWLSIDCSFDKDGNARTVDQVVPASVEEVWQWNAEASATSFVEQPSIPSQPDSQWKVWKRNGVPLENTLSLMTGNQAYVIKAEAGAPGSFTLKGRPVAPVYTLKSSGANFLGFPTQSLTNFTNFLSFSEVLKNAPQIFYYDGETAATSRRLVTPNTKVVTRGLAYWVKGSAYTDYYGPLKVTVQSSNGIDFDKRLTTASIRLKNVADPAKNRTINATLALVNSETAPGDATAFTNVPLRVRGPRDANLEYTYTDLSTGTYPVTLGPGDEVEIVLDANRSALTVPGKHYAGVLRITDDVVNNRVDLPVSAVGSSRQGVWVGAAVLNAVNQVETFSGPEFDAPIGTPDGETKEIIDVVTTTKTTTGGTVTQDNVADLDFDAAGRAYLNAPVATNILVAPWSPPTLIDEGFDPGANGEVQAIALQADGKIVVGGSFTELGGQPRNRIGRLNADGTLDPSFNPGADAQVTALEIQADGKILVGGDFSMLGGQSRTVIGRLNADGSLDTGFNPGANGVIWDFAVQLDNKIIVCGIFTTIAGQARSYIGRLNDNGTIDTTFAQVGANGKVATLELQSDGKILMGGSFTSPGERIARLNPDGTLDTSFNAGAADATVNVLALQLDGKIVVGGDFSNLGGKPRRGLGRLNADGSLDESFDPKANDYVKTLARQSDGKLLVGGGFSALGGQPRSHLGRLNADGSLDRSFNPGTNYFLNSLKIQSDGKILVGRYFTMLDGSPRSRIGRLNQDAPVLLAPATEGVGSDYTVISSTRAIVTRGGSGYTSAPTVTLTGGGGSGATATAVLSGGVAGTKIASGGSGYTTAPTVTFAGDGSGAAGMAVVQDGLVTDVTITNPGSGYSAPPTISFSGGGGTGAAATARITGALGSVNITAGGSGYTSAPVVVFSGGEGSGAEAVAALSGDVVTGVSAIEKVGGGSIGARARVTYTTVTPAPAGTQDGIVTTESVSTSKVVTLNGKSHKVIRRVISGAGGAAPSEFPVRLIVHSPATGSPTLLQQAYLGTRNGVQYVSSQEGSLTVAGSLTALVKGPLTEGGEPVSAGELGRVSSASFPRGQKWTGTGGFSSAASFTVTLGHDAATNPFVHTYHPDHDNWNERYEARLVSGQESYTVNRQITLSFNPIRPPGVSELTWGVTTIGGTYTEVITGLRAGEGISVSGPFILQQVSEAATLTP